MVWDAQPGPQTSALLADWCKDLLLAGGRFSGKSFFQLGYQEDAALRYGGKSRGIMFRKTYPELEELQVFAREIFSASGAVYKLQPSEGFPFTNCWYWPNGATVKMRYIENVRDYGRYHGHSFSHISVDEACEYADPSGLYKLMSTLRSSYGVPCSIRFTGNPGGAGHAFFKQRYIDFSPPYTPKPDPDSGIQRMWIPGTMADNPIGMQHNPDYRNIIIASAGGNKLLMQAWLDNDWDIVAGAFFGEFSRQKHVIAPFTIPVNWVRLMGFDWGSSSPFAALWCAVSTGEIEYIPRGALVFYREWYGASPNASGSWIGLKMISEDVADGIAQRERGEKIDVRVIDPSAFKEDGGPSHGERMGNRGVHFIRADNTRILGWDLVRARLQWQDPVTQEEFAPMVYFFDTCVHTIRTLPLMQHDEHRIEDVETDNCEDHIADALRYVCAARPWIRDDPKKVDKLKEFVDKRRTFNDVLKQHRKRRLSMT